jgi:hypothetical protein
VRSDQDDVVVAGWSGQVGDDVAGFERFAGRLDLQADPHRTAAEQVVEVLAVGAPDPDAGSRQRFAVVGHEVAV